MRPNRTFLLLAGFAAATGAVVRASSTQSTSVESYIASTNERARQQTLTADAKAVTKDVPTEMYERAQKLYPEELWKEIGPGHTLTPIKLIKAVPAKYPLAYRLVATEGEVWVGFVVDATGKVTDVKPLTEFDSKFVAAAIKAVKQWKFEPATRDGKPVPALVTVPIQFRLEKR